MTIDATFLTTLKAQTQPSILTVDGKSYSTAALHNLPLPLEPCEPSVALASLDSLLDYAKMKAPELTEAQAFVICEATYVTLLSKPKGENRQRDRFATVETGNAHFDFGAFMDLESFRIALLTQFADSVFRVQVLQFVAKVTDSSVKMSEDDGTSQTVTVKQGIASYGAATVPSPITLQPIRTFIEVEQPEGKFLLRLKQQEKGLPLVGLFELHTNWQRAAAMATRDYLVSKGCPVPVFA